MAPSSPASPDRLRPDSGDEDTEQIPLRARLLNRRTALSVAVAGVLAFFLGRAVLGDNFDFESTWRQILAADLALLALAFACYYLTFPLRGLRWWFILARAGTKVRPDQATRILFLSWFVNCVVPAKLGDAYRAYLLRASFGASSSRTLGTVFIERVADVLAIALLAIAAGLWSFRDYRRPEVDALLITGAACATALFVIVVAFRLVGKKLVRRLPTRLSALYERFHEGSTMVLTPRNIPFIAALTIAIWLLEGGRVYFVIQALDLPSVRLGVSSSIFVALAAALVTAIPLTPAGIGFVELAMVTVLSLYGVGAEAATAVALTDRAISIVSVLLIGGMYYASSGFVRRAHALGSLPSPRSDS